MRTAIYIRVSTDDQAKEGFSLAAQSQRLRAYCESQDWAISDIYADEGYSAKDTERPALQRMLSDIRSGRLDVVLVWRLDRLTRSVLDLYQLLRVFDKNEVGFKSATEVFDTTTAIGRLFITIVAAMAQWERENIGERVALGMAQKAREGKRVTSVAPMGYSKQGDSLVVDETRAPIVRDIFLRYAGGWGIHRIGLYLESEYGIRWDKHTLGYILDNPVYVGQLRWGYRSRRIGHEVILVNAAHDPLIDSATWQAVRQVRDRKRVLPPRSGTGKYPFAGLVFCKKCGARMVGYQNATAHLYYRCANYPTKHCAARMVRADLIERATLQLLRTLHAPSSELLKAKAQVPGKPRPDGRDVEKRRAELGQRKRRLWDAYELGGDLTELRVRLERVRQEEVGLDEHPTVSPEINEEARWRVRVLEQAQHLEQGWSDLDNLERKTLLQSLIDRIDADRESVAITLSTM